MTTRSREALRRLGGPVCPVCDSVDADGKVEVRWISETSQAWLSKRGKAAIIRQSLAPMCGQCFSSMEREEIARRAEAAAQKAREDAAEMEESLYEARSNYEDDIAAAEEFAAAWDVGNGLFGRRGD
jgi:hypothetical protein